MQWTRHGYVEPVINHSSSFTVSMTTTPINSVEQTSATMLPTSDPLNVMGAIGGIVISLIIVTGVVGNLVVLIAIVDCPQLRRSYNAFIASLSVTDLIFNVTVMPFYVDTFVHRRWRFSEAVCRWHTFFGTTVIVSSSLHIVLIAVSRYHLIVRPRFYARWLSSAGIVVTQIVFAWLAAAAMTLPGIVDALPTKIHYSDQLSRCSYDRTESYGALSIIFCGGFILPCLGMGYCYVMIWRRAREVGQRVDGYNAYQLTKIRQQHQNSESVFTRHSQSFVAPVPSNACVNAQETVRAERSSSAGGEIRQPAAEDERTADVHRLRADQPSDGDRQVMDSPHATADGQDRLLSVVEAVPVNHPRVLISVDVTERGATTKRQSTERNNTATRSDCSDDSDDHDNGDNDIDNYRKDGSRQRSNSSGSHQLTAAPSLDPSSRFSASTRSSHVVERATGALDDHETTGNNVRLSANKVKEHEHLPAETQTPKRENITVVITPATTRSAAVAIRRESQPELPDVTGKNRETGNHLHCTTHDDDAHLSVERRQPRMSLFHRHEVGERSSPVSTSACHRHRSHSLHMILAVFFAFVLTYLPFTVTNLADQHARLDRNVYMITSLAFWSGSCVNPLIYGIMNVQFRRAYVSIVVNCWRHSFIRWRTRWSPSH